MSWVTLFDSGRETEFSTNAGNNNATDLLLQVYNGAAKGRGLYLFQPWKILFGDDLTKTGRNFPLMSEINASDIFARMFDASSNERSGL